MNSVRRAGKQARKRNDKRVDLMRELKKNPNPKNPRSFGVLQPLKVADLISYELDGEEIRRGSIKITAFGEAFLRHHAEKGEK